MMRLFWIGVGLAFLCACGGGAQSAPVSPVAGPSPVGPGPNATATPSPKPGSSPSPAPGPSSTPVPGSSPTPAPTPTTGPAGAIQHVVVIIQENRSVDNLFNGFPNANTQRFGLVKQVSGPPKTVALQQVPLAVTCDIDHGHLTWAGDWDNGQMDGFNTKSAPISCTTNNATPTPPNYAYSYVNPADVVPYWNMARNYTLMDDVFESPTSPSFEAHLHLIAGQSNNTSENPQYAGPLGIWGCDSPATTRAPLYNGLGDSLPGVFPCFTPPFPTIADLLDAKRLTWKYYAPAITASGFIWSAFDAVSSVRYGPDWANVISPQTRILTEAGNLASVTYVVPSFPDSDHSGANSSSGPAWVSSVVNAIGNSPQWNTTAIFVLWDDWGGWYDHVAPPVSQNFTIGGFRVPVLCISPYSEQTNPSSPAVNHNPHGFDGILTFIEQTFNLGSLNAQDSREAPFDDCFNFAQRPKPFVNISGSALFTTNYFLHEPASNFAPDNE